MVEIKEKIIPIYIEDEMKDSYIDYAMSVIIGRALPDVRDGLKPVHRRILYAMHQMGMTHNRPHKKSARIVGEVLGKYHPHGDAAVYDTLTRMVQDFSLRHPLIDGQGNFGSVDGDAPAAMRYTEVRLGSLAEEILKDIEKETVNFGPNFDGSLQEPHILPSAIPNLLVNGSSGIAVGMATNIPPHNLEEVVDGTIAVIDDPEIEVEKLIPIIKGPDFPTGALICGRSGIEEAYTTGRGHITVRARADIEKHKGGRESIIVKEIPFQVNKARLVESIANLVRAKKIEGIADLRDESDRKGMRVVIELKRGEIAQVLLNQLFKHTQLQTTFGVIMLALVNNRPRVLNLKQVIVHYIEHRRRVTVRRIEYELRKDTLRAHILEGLRIAIANLDKTIKIIRASKSPEEAEEKLIKAFELSEEQAQAILDMKLQRLTGLEREKIDLEYKELEKRIKEYKTILKDPQKVLDIISEELLAIKKKYGDKRRTQITKAAVEEFQVEDLIAEEDVAITVSHTGYIKRIPVSTYRIQRRGGRGVTGMGTKEEDFVEHLLIASTHQYILCFTNKGRIHWLKVYKIPQTGRAAKGKAIVNLLKLDQDEFVTTFIPVKEFDDRHFLIMATKKGVIKKTNLAAYSRPRAGGIIALRLDKGDELMKVKMTDGSQDVVLGTRVGLAIRFRETQVRGMGRGARGVRGIRLSKEDRVIGMEVIREEATLLAITENGYGKRTKHTNYRVQSRGGKGVINIQTTKRNGPVVGIKMVDTSDGLMIVTARGMIIQSPIKDIRSMGRNTQGVRLIRLKPEDKVVAIARVMNNQDREEAEVKRESSPDKRESEKVGKRESEKEVEVKKESSPDKRGEKGRGLRSASKSGKIEKRKRGRPLKKESQESKVKSQKPRTKSQK
ncbi:DNA gyrase subunit A [bacterium]|nr:DNA gyrase subunit A [bacterium]